MSNSSLAIRYYPEVERTLAYTSLSGTYAAVGTPFKFASLQYVLQNQTDAAVSFSIDGTNSMITLQAGSTFTSDVQANMGLGNAMRFAQGTQIYANTAGSPSKGAVYISTWYGAIFGGQ